jgi:hypothetical protein
MYGPTKGEVRLLFGLAFVGLAAVVTIIVVVAVLLIL